MHCSCSDQQAVLNQWQRTAASCWVLFLPASLLHDSAFLGRLLKNR